MFRMKNRQSVFTTGVLSGIFTGLFFLMASPAPAGAQIVTVTADEWAATYGGPDGGGDFLSAMTRDGSGNIFVTGTIATIAAGADIATIGYSPAGAQIWFAPFSTAAHDWATDVEVDLNGNVLVAGNSNNDFLTVKYNAAGAELWRKTYNGTAGGVDSAEELKVDALGNIYVSGWSAETGSGNNMTTIKYDPAGVELWRVHRAGGAAKALSLDSLNNVYVAGDDDGVGGMITIKYDTNGALQWEDNYSRGSAEAFGDLKVDSAGNAHVTGSSDGGATGLDYATIKYDPAGVRQWVAIYDGAETGPTRTDEAGALDVDATGNVFVAGKSFRDNAGVAGFDIATLKYDAAGVLLWEGAYAGSGNDDDSVSDIKVHSDGGVIVAGTTFLELGDREDFVAIKYSADGVEEWYDGSYTGGFLVQDFPVELILDAADTFYIGGTSGDVATNATDFILVKFGLAEIDITPPDPVSGCDPDSYGSWGGSSWSSSSNDCDDDDRDRYSGSSWDGSSWGGSSWGR